MKFESLQISLFFWRECSNFFDILVFIGKTQGYYFLAFLGWHILVLIPEYNILRCWSLYFEKILESEIKHGKGGLHSFLCNFSVSQFIIIFFWHMVTNHCNIHLKTEAWGRQSFKTCKKGNKSWKPSCFKLTNMYSWPLGCIHYFDFLTKHCLLKWLLVLMWEQMIKGTLL